MCQVHLAGSTPRYQVEHPFPTRCCRRRYQLFLRHFYLQVKVSWSSNLTFLRPPLLDSYLRLMPWCFTCKGYGLPAGPGPLRTHLQDGRGPTCHSHSQGGYLKEGGSVAELVGQNNNIVAIMSYHCLKNLFKSLSDLLLITCIHFYFKWHIGPTRSRLGVIV